MSEEIGWKHIADIAASAKHIFESEEADHPICRRNSKVFMSKWIQHPGRLKLLPECRACVKKYNKPPQPLKLHPEDFTWKYISGESVNNKHAFGKEATKPLCGQSPSRANSYWADDQYNLDKRMPCKRCRKAVA